MASEIRVNQIQNRSGLTTTTLNDQGVVVAGIVTANSFMGIGTSKIPTLSDTTTNSLLKIAIQDSDGILKSDDTKKITLLKTH